MGDIYITNFRNVWIQEDHPQQASQLGAFLVITNDQGRFITPVTNQVHDASPIISSFPADAAWEGAPDRVQHRRPPIQSETGPGDVWDW